MGRRRALVLTLLASLAVCIPGRPAGAHEEVPGVRNELDTIEPPLPSAVTFNVVVSAADQVVASNDTDMDLMVPGSAGEPFLVIGPDGVLANFRSPTWHRSVNPDEGGALPTEADASAPPRFVRVSRQPVWGWFDHRLHAAPVRSAPPTGPGETVVLETWEIPFRIGDVDHVARGRRVFARPRGTFVSRIETAPDGVQAVVLGGLVPAVALSAPDTVRIELLDPDGAVFARTDQDGVEVNEASTLWQLTEAVRAAGTPPESPTGPGADPRFVPYEAGGQIIWLEPRAVYPDELPPDDVSSTDPTVVARWAVPVRINERPAEILGVTEWVPDGTGPTVPTAGAVPPGNDSRLTAWVLAGLGVCGSGALVVALSRRRAA